MNALAQVRRLIAEDLPSAAPATPPTIDAAGGHMAFLAARWVKAVDQAEVDFQRFQDAAVAAMALHPARPEETIPRDHFTGAPWDAPRDWFVRYQFTNAVIAYDRWQAQKAAIDAAAGMPELEARSEAAFAAADALSGAIVQMRPTSAAEAALKFGVLLKRYGDGQGEIDTAAPVFAFLDDLEHLAQLARAT